MTIDHDVASAEPIYLLQLIILPVIKRRSIIVSVLLYATMRRATLFNSFRFCCQLVVLLVSLESTFGETFDIDWKTPSDEKPYDEFTAFVGDTINFSWTGTHDVWIHNALSCDMFGRTRVKGTTPPGSHTFTADEGSQWGEKVFFACDIGGHCEKGQHLIVTVFSTEEDRNTILGTGGSGVSGEDPNPTQDPPQGSGSFTTS